MRMFASCVAVGCPSSRNNCPDLGFHRIPTNTEANWEVWSKWIQNLYHADPLPKDENFSYLRFILEMNVLKET